MRCVVVMVIMDVWCSGRCNSGEDGGGVSREHP